MAKLLDKILVDPYELVVLAELEFYNLMRGDDDDLEDQILVEGRIRDPIVVWVHEGKLILTDGHRRRKIVIKHKMQILFEANLMEFENIEEAKDWIQLNQQNRRNLTDDQHAYFEGMQYNKLKNNHKRMISFLKLKGKMDLLNGSGDDSEIHTAQLLGKIYRKDEKTIRRNGQFARGIELIREKNSNLAEQILRQTVCEDGRNVKVNRALVEKFGALTPPKTIDTLFDVQEAVDSVSKKSHDKYGTEKEEIIILVEKFLEKVTSPLKEEVDNKISQYFIRHSKDGQKGAKMVA